MVYLNKIVVTVFLLCGFFLEAVAQHPLEKCATVQMGEYIREKHGITETQEDFEKWLAPKVVDYKKSKDFKRDKSISTIPVVIHIIHNSDEAGGEGRNISNAQAVSQIDVLNEDFTRTNADASNTPAEFSSVAANCEINFCLARFDPNGNLMNERGINRVSTDEINGISNTTTGYSPNTINDIIKPATQWDPTKYMNIWVCQINDDILGYAQFPSSSTLPGILSNEGPASTDGVVITPTVFGRVGNLDQFYYLGRTTTHEVGHWLGLIHIWGDSFCGNDYCDDTPTQETSNVCVSHPSPSCGNSGDMFMNYMDYGEDVCLNIFTEDQKARMQTVLQNSPRRNSLLSSTVCDEEISQTECDTVSNIDNTDTPVLIVNTQGSWGWVTGHNDFNDIGKAEFFTTSSAKEVSGVELFFVKTHAGSSSSTISVKVWDNNNGAPGTVLTEETLAISDLEVYPTPTNVTFNSPANVTDTFFVGIEFAANGTPQDSIALMSNRDGESAPGTAWEKWGDGTWAAVSAVDAWEIDISMGINPILCDEGLSIEEQSGNANDVVVYPNPSNGFVTVRLSDGVKDVNTISVIDALGNIVLRQTTVPMDNDIQLDLLGQSKGFYFVTIETDVMVIVKKISIM